MTDLFTPLRNKIDQFLTDLRCRDLRPRCIKLSTREWKMLRAEEEYATFRVKDWQVHGWYRCVPLRLVSRDVWTR